MSYRYQEVRRVTSIKRRRQESLAFVSRPSINGKHLDLSEESAKRKHILGFNSATEVSCLGKLYERVFRLTWARRVILGFKKS